MSFGQTINQYLAVFAILIGIWLILLSYLIYKMISHYNNLTKSTKAESLEKILDSILRQANNFDEKIDKIDKSLQKNIADSYKHIQKVAVLRFNPYQDTGGDQSFIVSLLDKNDSGLVITSMHGRDRTRIYAKPVIAGSAKDHELSKEEQKAVNIARKE